MTLHALSSPRFVRKTQLGPGEYRKNFHQIDGDVISAVTSHEADRVTPLMSKIYLRLVHAPTQYWERDGVLRFEGELGDNGHVTAWAAMCEVLGVASATAAKALRWMHEQGIVGYFAGKNGVGIRVFLNRAMSSIGTRAGQKFLEFPRASPGGARASRNEAAFSDSFAVLEVSDTDTNPRAPKNGAEQTMVVKTVPDPCPTSSQHLLQGPGERPAAQQVPQVVIPVEKIVSRLRRELEPSLESAARRAASQEHERTREWLESRGLPKAARVAQREAYNVLRKYGVIKEGVGNASAHACVGRNEYNSIGPHRLPSEEIEELAQACVAMLETKGQSVEVTLSEMSIAAGGFLLAEDAPLVREKAETLIISGTSSVRKD